MDRELLTEQCGRVKTFIWGRLLRATLDDKG